MEIQSTPLPGHIVSAYPVGAIRVSVGANQGDPIGGIEDCLAGDIYRLKPEARPKRLVVARQLQAGDASGSLPQLVGPGSEIGMAGDRIQPMALLTLMAPDGERLVIVTLRHEDSGAKFALPLSPMVPRTEYTLVDISDDFSDMRLSDVICISFAAGTLITRPGGRPDVIENLRPGDLVLTRDHDAQPIRWIGKATLRATGSFAPVVISSGTLGNLGDLVVSPHHRVFIYQRGHRRISEIAEILVQAKHLVDGDRVFRREGGYVDYYSLVFDRHEIIFAEGIPAESLMVNETTVSLLPEALAAELIARFPGLRQSQHYGNEAHRAALDAGGRASLFRPE
ncbi:MAG: Hint domain-containing protein [Rhodobacteraceae bacterium]|nr:Hint domain-containing protein [Paracoccaceae bacterium]